jgi:diphosphomevalonate decarboxylase
LARRGSASAARSIFGGLVLLPRGQHPDGEDCFATPLPAGDWALRMVVAITPAGRKQMLSRDGMRATAETSPYYPAWLAQSEPDLEAARRAIATHDLERLGDVAERSCLAMHASAMAARPAIVYFSGVTIEGFHAVRGLRRAGVPAWFTCDAGPHVKALTDAAHADKVAARLAEVPGVVRTLVCSPGAGAEIIE